MDTSDISNVAGLIGTPLHGHGGGAGGMTDTLVRAQTASSSQADFMPYAQLSYGPAAGEYTGQPFTQPTEYPSYPSSEAWSVIPQTSQTVHGQRYSPLDSISHFTASPQSYPQHFPQFANQYVAAQRQSATALAPAQVDIGTSTVSSAVVPGEIWNKYSPAGVQATSRSARNVTSTRAAPSLAPRSQQQTRKSTQLKQPTPASKPSPSIPSPALAMEFRIKGCPNVTVRALNDPSLNLPPEFFQMISGASLGNETPVPAAPPKKNQKPNTVAVAISKPQTPKPLPVPPPKPKIPDDPIERTKVLIQEALECDGDDDIEDIRRASKKIWDIMVQIKPEQSQLVEVAVRTILKAGDDEILRALGDSVLFAIRLRKWMTTEWNRDRNSPAVLLILKLLYKFRLSEEDLEQSSWVKALKSIGSKSEDQKTREICQAISKRAKERSAKEREEKAKEKQEKQKAALLASSSLSDRTNDKERSLGNGTTARSEASSNLNVGIKRKSEDEIKVGPSAPKKVAVGEGKNSALSSSLSARAGLSTGSSKNGASSSTIEKKLTTSTVTGVNGSTASAKPKTTAAGFFKSLQGNRAAPTKVPTKPVEKKVTPNPGSAPEQKGAFTSIFDQLVRQQKEVSTGGKSDSESKKRDADDDTPGANKKVKKKKTVRWKTGDELAKVKVIEWVEPEGEYYGGGSGHESHEYGNARNFDVEEGREALAALKNRNFLEDDDDLLDWYQPPRIDFRDMHTHLPGSLDNAIKRGGNKETTSEEAKSQSQRELNTLSALYSSPASIPYSPQEPDPSHDGSQEPENPPITIPLPDHLKQQQQQQQLPVTVPDLSAILSAFQTPVQQPAQIQAQTAANNIIAQLQAITRTQQQPAPVAVPFAQPVVQQLVQPAPAPAQQAPVTDISSILAALGAVNPNQQQTPQQQANTSFLQNLVQQNPVTQGQAPSVLDNMLAQLGFNGSFSAAQPTPASGSYEAPAGPKGWAAYESQLQQPFGNNGQSAWTGGSGTTDEPGRAAREGEREKEGRSSKDVRGALREATGWDERKSEVERQNSSGGGSGSESTRGTWSGGKHKKEKKGAKVACLFFQKGTCKNGDNCRFLHDKKRRAGPGTGTNNASGGSGNGGSGGGGGASWPSSGEMEY